MIDQENGIVARFGLTLEDLAAIKELEQVCNAEEGLTLKLNWDLLQSRTSEYKDYLLYVEDGKLIGFLAIFCFHMQEAEITGMVHPAHRRQGVFRQMYAAAVDTLCERGVEKTILIVDAKSQSGKAFAEAVGTTYGFSEYKMDLGTFHPAARVHETLTLEPAVREDLQFVETCMSEAFNLPYDPDEERWEQSLAEPHRHTLLLKVGGERVGVMNARMNEGESFLFGFAVKPEFQKNGYGRQALSDTIQMCLDAGHPNVSLEVAVKNERALGLYQSVGFETVSAYDYYEVPTEYADITRPVRQQLDAYNKRDIDAFMACYADDCVVEDGLGNVTMTGTQAMRESYTRMFAESPELHCHLASRIVLREYVIDEERVTGRSGRAGMSHVVAVYHVEKGKIARVRFLR